MNMNIFTNIKPIKIKHIPVDLPYWEESNGNSFISRESILTKLFTKLKLRIYNTIKIHGDEHEYFCQY